MSFFEQARDAALTGIRSGAGRPFGASIVRDDEVVCAASNTSARDMDPTAHAELAAVRKACKILGTVDLSDCVIYATGEPCPMCIGAMILAGIKRCFYASTAADLEAAGIPGNGIGAYLQGTQPDTFSLINVSDARATCAVVLHEWRRLHL